MKQFFQNKPMLGFFIVAVAATVVSAWLLNPQSGPFGRLSSLFTSGLAGYLEILGVVAILIAGAGITYIALRLAQYGTAAAFAAGGGAADALTPADGEGSGGGEYSLVR